MLKRNSRVRDRICRETCNPKGRANPLPQIARKGAGDQLNPGPGISTFVRAILVRNHAPLT
jgi:hypothetical protein